MHVRRLALLLAGVGSTGCLSLGPMPATTGASAVPAGRADVAVQGGWVPGFTLSQSTQARPKGSARGQLAALVEPDAWVGVPGLVAGARAVLGSNGDDSLEPLAGYRAHVDRGRRVAVLAIGGATRAGKTVKGASYSATRASAELVADGDLFGESRIAELHLFGGVSASALSARGTYCVDADRRYGVDCDLDRPDRPTVRGEVGGVYPALTGGAAAEFGRHLPSFFHGGRVALHVAYGQMPSVVGGVEGERRGYSAGGLTITIGGGAR